jgi:hypothetical protein
LVGYSEEKTQMRIAYEEAIDQNKLHAVNKNIYSRAGMTVQ